MKIYTLLLLATVALTGRAQAWSDVQLDEFPLDSVDCHSLAENEAENRYCDRMSRCASTYSDDQDSLRQCKSAAQRLHREAIGVVVSSGPVGAPVTMKTSTPQSGITQVNAEEAVEVNVNAPSNVVVEAPQEGSPGILHDSLPDAYIRQGQGSGVINSQEGDDEAVIEADMKAL